MESRRILSYMKGEDLGTFENVLISLVPGMVTMSC